MKSINKRNRLMLSDKIAEALTVKPRADIEDDQVFGTKPQTVSREELSSSESDEEIAISDFRKRNVNLLSEISEKYIGHVVSQKDHGESDVDSSLDGHQAFADNEIAKSQDSTYKKGDDNKFNLGLESQTSDEEDDSDDYDIVRSQKSLDSVNESTANSEEDDDGESYDISQMEEPVSEKFEHMKKQDVSEDEKKGNCVRNQLLLWEGLLEMRIHLQRCMNTANQMPMPDTFEDLKQNEVFIEDCNATTAQVTNVLDKFLMLQEILLKNFPETKAIIPKDNVTEKQVNSNFKSDEEIPSDSENEEIPSDTDVEENFVQESPIKKEKKSTPQPKKRKLDEYEKILSLSHKSFKQFRDSTIQKWNDKTRITTTASLKNGPTNTILQQISFILSDRNKLVKRTQLKRSEYEIVGYEADCPEPQEYKVNDIELAKNPEIINRKENDEYIPEIFDDSDFYHQLLRELIECKSADITDPVQLSRQWIALQQMRSKMKRKVDTKATKGRKIKYVVHNQLVNFMAPEKSMTWTDESANELYSSLFGKMFEHSKMDGNTSTNSELKFIK